MDITRFTPKRIYTGIKRRWYIKTGNYKKLADFCYFFMFRKRINWESPEDLNQWINWLAFNTDTDSWSILADKYQVRNYIANKGYADNLVPLLAVWDSPDKICFENLPTQCVLKINNGSGDVQIILDKNSADITEIKAYFASLFHHPFGRDTAEPHYLHIKPLIIAEKLLDIRKQIVKSSSLVDYKFWCFNGQPAICFVCSNRTKEHLTIDLYSANEDWQRIEDGNLVYDCHYKKATLPMPKPSKLSEMLKIASELSQFHPQIRIDFYEVDRKVYIGELTLTSACGRMEYFTESCLKDMGMKCSTAVKNLVASGKLKTI